MFLQPVIVVPLSTSSSDQEKVVVIQCHNRHLSDNATLVIGKVTQPNATGFGHVAGDHL